MRRLGIPAVVLALTAVVSTGTASHCSDLLIYSGPVQPPQNPVTTGGYNLGVVGCLRPAMHEADTNVLTPGATFLRVAATDHGHAAPSGGRVVFAPSGASTALAFVRETAASGGSRWISQVVSISPGVSAVTASAAVPGASGSPLETSITYRAAA